MISGPLVSAAWLREHLGDPDLRLVQVSPDRNVYDARHIPGAIYGDLHRELALRGRAPETGDVEREWLVPDASSLAATLGRWGVGEGDRVVLYDDVGQNRHAIRGYWLLRLYGWPDGRAHVLDGGLGAWERAGGEVTSDAPAVREVPPVRLGPPREELIARTEQVEEWCREAAASGPVRVLDVREPQEYRGEDVRARRGGHLPGAANLPFTELLTPEGTFRSPDEIRRLAAAATGGHPEALRATYCQGGVRAALAWFALHELAGLKVANYAASWEEWGNREDLPIEQA